MDAWPSGCCRESNSHFCFKVLPKDLQSVCPSILAQPLGSSCSFQGLQVPRFSLVSVDVSRCWKQWSHLGFADRKSYLHTGESATLEESFSSDWRFFKYQVFYFFHCRQRLVLPCLWLFSENSCVLLPLTWCGGEILKLLEWMWKIC